MYVCMYVCMYVPMLVVYLLPQLCMYLCMYESYLHDCMCQIRRFGSDREIDVDDDDIEFIVQQVGITGLGCHNVIHILYGNCI